MCVIYISIIWSLHLLNEYYINVKRAKNYICILLYIIFRFTRAVCIIIIITVIIMIMIIILLLLLVWIRLRLMLLWLFDFDLYFWRVDVWIEEKK